MYGQIFLRPVVSNTENSTIVAGSSFTFECKVTAAEYVSDGATIFIQLKGPTGKKLKSDSGGLVNSIRHKLNPVSTSDAGLYTCLSYVLMEDTLLGKANSTMELTVLPIGL